MNWKEALELAQQQPPFVDRMKRRCREIENITVSLTSNYTQPLEQVRGLGWIYPSDQELASIILGDDQQHIYTYSNQIQQQLPEIIKLLRHNPNTRRALIQLSHNQVGQQRHVPAMIAAYVSVREEHLRLTIYARSIDLLVGLPANIYQSYILAKKISQEINKPLHKITFMINSAHIFEDYQEELEHVLNTQNP